MKFVNELKPPLEDALEHYGVLGMKWGVRKDKNSTKSRKTRKEKKAEKRKAIQERAEKLVDMAVKNETHLFKINTLHGATVFTGKEFVEYLEKGGVFDAKTSDVWEYQLNDSKPWKT